MQNIIESLKNQQLLWQSSDLSTSGTTLSSGYSALDTLLDGGFPTQGVVHIESATGIGEIRMLMPYLHTHQNDGLIVFIQPPADICAASLAYCGLHLRNIWVIQPQTPQHALWAAEQCLKSSACRHVLLWQSELEIHHIKRLQLACEQGENTLFIYKHPQVHSLSLPVTLSLQLTPHPRGINVRLLKRKGGWQHGETLLNYQSLYSQLTLYSTREARHPNTSARPLRAIQ